MTPSAPQVTTPNRKVVAQPLGACDAVGAPPRLVLTTVGLIRRSAGLVSAAGSAGGWYRNGFAEDSFTSRAFKFYLIIALLNSKAHSDLVYRGNSVQNKLQNRYLRHGGLFGAK